MRSTERRFAKLARRVYFDHIVRLAEARRRSGRGVFPLVPDPGETSYFVKPERSRPDKAAMGEDITASPERFLAALEAHWRMHGDDDLIETIATLGAVASAARALAEEAEESDDVSAFIYAMF